MSETGESTNESGDSASESGVLLAYYGDDLTGSTDVLEALSLNGVPTVLFLERPEPGDLAEFDADVRAVGIAGMSRSMTPEEMTSELPPAFESLARFDPSIVQYKVCSTFDSSPEVGSIGRAIDLGQETFGSPFVPVVVAAPSLAPRGRYVLFGNLFATLDGETYRIDRPPTMSEHPVTPMTEGDLRRHLAAQTDRETADLEVRHLDGVTGVGPDRALDDATEDGEIVVCDGLNHEHQETVGRLLWDRAREAPPLFSASSSGLNYALAAHWQSSGLVAEPESPPALPAVDQVVVVSGSASPVNAGQIDWALEHGFEGVRLDGASLVDPGEADTAVEAAVEEALDALAAGRSVLLYSARGPDDPAIDATTERARELGVDENRLGRRLGEQQGRILRRLLKETDIGRACIAGGDTSGHVAPALDLYALEFLAPVGPGSPLCRARSRTDAFDGLEIALKGGQVETRNEAADFFGLVREGGRPSE